MIDKIVGAIVLALEQVDALYEIAQKLGHSKKDLDAQVKEARKQRTEQVEKDRAEETKGFVG